MNSESTLTVGIYQPQPRDDTPGDKLARLENVFENEAARACDLIVCPELFLSGYFVHDKILERAQPRDGPFARGACELARRFNCAIAYGYPESAEGRVFNSALCAGPDGSVAANHRKCFLPYDYEEKYFRHGRQPTTFELKGWKIGMVICYEAEFPEPTRYYAQSGCELVIAPTALTVDWPVVAHRVIPARAFESSVFFAYSNYAGEENGSEFMGASVIVSPFGKDLVRAGPDEDVVTARLNRAEIARARDRLHFLEDVRRSCYR